MYAAAPVKTIKIGYLIPEFPGQTHNFFWRERHALREEGIDTALISTRRPPRGIVSASWAAEAAGETAYLMPMSPLGALRVLAFLLRAGPAVWYRCARVVVDAKDMKPIQRLRLAALLPFGAALATLSRQQGWRHVHVHSCADAANVALFASRLSPCTYSLTLHGRLGGYGPNQAQKWAGSAFAITISDTLRRQVDEVIGRHLPRRLGIAPMGVNVEVFTRAQPYQAYTGAGVLELFSCGRLNQGKGYTHLLRAVAILRQLGMEVRLRIAGEDEQGGSGHRRELERQLAEEGLQDCVTLLGAVAEERIRECLETTHLFVLASLDEALGVVLMEAMAMSVPVIATRVGGVPELVSDGVDGLLVPPADAQAIADAVLALARDPARAQGLSLASRQKIVDAFSHRRSARTLAGLLRETQDAGLGTTP
ncbi:MAG: exopolysaccharide biosynthesis GT4 family glycosyltransferase EpsE [Pseudomonadota bacterium]